MVTIPFDTLKLAEKLEASGFTAAQARGAASAFAESMGATELATKADLIALEARLDARITTLEYRMTVKLGAMLAASIAIIAALVKLL
ncbi:MAG: hypothetical protein OHK0024_06310 [Thalassobaculales bacterium]